MNNYIIIFTLSTVLFLASCEPDPPKPNVSIKDRRDQFIGFYKVKHGNYYYTLFVDKLDSVGKQFIIVKNFNNNFNFITFFDGGLLPYNYLDMHFPYPAYTNFNRKRFAISYNNNDTIPNLNLLVNGRINLYYEIHNAPWWGEDWIPFKDSFYYDIAIKQ